MDGIDQTGNSWYPSPQGNKPLSRASPKVPSKRPYEEVENDTQESGINDAKTIITLNQKRSKGEKKQQRMERRKQAAAVNSHPTTASVADETSKDNVKLNTSGMKRQQDVSSTSESATRPEEGFRSGSIIYPSLGNIRCGKTTSLIGVVVGISSPKKTVRGEFMRWVQIVDASIYNTKSSGIKINCFSRGYEEWLPAPNYGDILILCDVKIQLYHGALVGTGYHDKLRWAACSPLGQIHHGFPNSAPQSEVLEEGRGGVLFSPFYHPTKEEILYCVRVSDWWRDLQKPTLQKELPAPIPSTRSPSNVRVHRLISEAGPDVPPQGYFDCTVEVLKGYRSDYRPIYSLYVTDYSQNEQAAPVQYHWCPEGLSNYVLLIEMWDAASEVGSSMRPGEFYEIKNVRMKANNKTGYMEAKLQQPKILRLDPHAALVKPHLKALLERKRKWEEEQQSDESEAQYCLIQDFQSNKFFNCAVEVLQTMDVNSNPCLYVTDYTSHPSLESPVFNESWAQGLNGYIVKIFLRNEQQQMAKSISPGSFYSIRKLRLNDSTIEGCVCGHLGGSERLITQANPNRTDNEHLNGLLRRKGMWEDKVRRKGPQPVEEQRPPPTHTVRENAGRKQADHPCLRFQDIPPVTQGPIKLSVYAKAVSFHPLDLDDTVYQFCSRCQAEIPLKRRACITCDDFEHEYVEYKYQLFLFVEDERKDQILISVNDTSPIWNGLKRVPLREDNATRENFRVRLNPLLGNLPLVHEAYIAGKSLEKETSFHVLELDSWINADLERGYCLHKYY